MLDHKPEIRNYSLFRMSVERTSTNTGQGVIPCWLPTGRQPGKHLSVCFTPWTSRLLMSVFPLNSCVLRLELRGVTRLSSFLNCIYFSTLRITNRKSIVALLNVLSRFTTVPEFIEIRWIVERWNTWHRTDTCSLQRALFANRTLSSW
jgi:hypothetical protein